MLTLELALRLVESVHCGFYRSPGRGACESGNVHESGDRAHCRLPSLTCADVLVVHEGTLPDNSHSGSPRAPACLGKASRKRWHFILRDEWEESKGTKGACWPLGLRPGEARELVPVVEALKAVHAGLGLGSGSSEHKMCLRPG